jgi:dihydrofolate reductase
MKLANINMIVAANEDMAIGQDNDLPWHLPNDLKNFKEITNGHPVIMGRKCWESIPEKFRPLPNRTNIVLTRNGDYFAKGAKVRHNLKDAVEEFMVNNDELFIIGGAQIYKEAFEICDYLYFTRVFCPIPKADTFLEGFDKDKWEIMNMSGLKEDNGIPYRFETYKRNW